MANSVKKAVCQPGLSRMCQALDLLIRSLYPKLSSQHVYSHDEQPWNEFADSLCTFSRFRMNNQAVVCSIVTNPISSADINALCSFVVFRDPNIYSQLVDLRGDYNGIQQCLSPETIAQWIDEPPTKEDFKADLQTNILSFLQYNCQTIKGDNIIDVSKKFEYSSCQAQSYFVF